MRSLLPIMRMYWAWVLLAAGGAGAFLFWPGGFADKARLLLHGLCAQTPTHSYAFGGVLLPFDARMTGIYGGALATLAVLALQGGRLRSGFPPMRIIAVLAIFVLALASDGFNSLFTDLGLPHPWEPRNELRLVTGYATGITLAVVLAWLLASTTWRLSTREPVVGSWRILLLAWLPFVPYALAVTSGAAWLYVPLSLLLVLSAWIVLSMLTLAMILLALRWDDRIRRSSQLHVPGTLAGLAGLGVMLLLAFGRVWLERVTGIPSTL